MKCLYCGKTLADDSSEVEFRTGWHKGCVKKFFGVSELPYVDLSEERLRQLADESISRGFTVPGVQKKLSLHLSNEDKPRLTLVNYPTGYILKPQTEEYPALPEAEHLVMHMAKATGIKTVPFGLIRIGDENTQLVYITKRIDRVTKKNKLQKLAMEDFCQLEERLTKDKYKGSYERCAKVVEQYSTRAKLDLAEIYLRILFSYVIGNSDMHLKNFSLIETKEGNGEYVLSEAYDMLPVNVIIPEDTEELALTLKGKKRKFKREEFVSFGEGIGLAEKVCENMIRKIISLEPKYNVLIDESYLPENMKENLCQLIRQRVAVLNQLSSTN